MHPSRRPPSVRRAQALAALLGAALAAAPASAAHAQFGGLVKRAAAAAAGKAVGDRAAEAGLPVGGRGGRADENRLEITPERVDAFVAGMRGPLEGYRLRAAYEAAQEAHEAAGEDYKAKKDKYDECKERLTDGVIPDMRSPALQRAVVRFTDGNVKLTEQRQQALAAGDVARARRLSDSTHALMLAVEEASFPTLRRQCGAPPREPLPLPAMDDGQGPKYRPAPPEGMTPTQFGVLRERIGAFLVADGAGGGLSPAERQVLEGRRAALAPLVAYYRSGRGWIDVLDGMR